jgi:hypothetical protein
MGHRGGRLCGDAPFLAPALGTIRKIRIGGQLPFAVQVEQRLLALWAVLPLGLLAV